MAALLALYENALREIVEALSSGQDDAAQIALEIASDALTHAGAASCE